MTLKIGTVLQNRYRIVSLLGQGGMGAVYRAWDLRLEIPVALKEMTPQPGLDEESLQKLQDQFHREAALVAKLDHPNLVNVSDFFEEDLSVYLVMSFVEGENLHAYITRTGALSEAQVLDWAEELLDALSYIHNQGVIHRDIKPQNVILSPDGHVILVDFGLVKLWNPKDPRTQTVIRSMGTPGYAPPEQYDPARGHTDPRSDLYSLGATLYHALTGQTPPTATERVVHPESLNPIRHFNPHISPSVETTLLRAMALRPPDRFQSAQEMWQALQQPSTSTPTPSPILSPPEQAPTASSKRNNLRWIWILPVVAMLLFCLLVTGGSVFYFLFRPPADTRAVSSSEMTATSTIHPSPTASSTLPASSTARPKATSTSTPTETPPLRVTSTPLQSTFTPTPTPIPPTDTSPTCSPVTGTFAGTWQQHQNQLGCARSNVYSTWTAQEHFEGGHMIWREDTDRILVLYSNGTWASYGNTWQEGDPIYTCPESAPSQSPPTPLRGFGRIWCTQANVRSRLGNATDAEQGLDSLLQDFENGTLLKTESGVTYILYANYTWER